MGPRPKVPVRSKKKGDPAVYVRFVCSETISGKKSRLGVFAALDYAEESELAPGWALTEIGQLYGWFQENLAFPDRYSKSGGKGHGQPGLSWFRAEADEHIQRMYRLKAALEECGVHVDVFTTRDPGEIIYRDAHQIVAEPGNRKFRS